MQLKMVPIFSPAFHFRGSLHISGFFFTIFVPSINNMYCCFVFSKYAQIAFCTYHFANCLFHSTLCFFEIYPCCCLRILFMTLTAVSYCLQKSQFIHFPASVNVFIHNTSQPGLQQRSLTVKGEGPGARFLGSNPSSIAYQLCGLRKVPLFVKWEQKQYYQPRG